jgi:hypothetical protein
MSIKMKENLFTREIIFYVFFFFYILLEKKRSSQITQLTTGWQAV